MIYLVKQGVTSSAVKPRGNRLELFMKVFMLAE